ncbi:Hypothetical predicted protein [Octopus vulgaris]|uniref:Uncharacterized protein n=1 Tax=Octopus vulgaris TaxID=6645 RepID=A0AA36EYW8_OCTVU|nr:Hypothetical predicted protein [Octopus vulgaris]
MHKQMKKTMKKEKTYKGRNQNIQISSSGGGGGSSSSSSSREIVIAAGGRSYSTGDEDGNVDVVVVIR